MTIGLVGRKVGMTRIFTEDGTTVPVTVLDVSDNRVTQIKTPEVDGYAAVQVTFGKRRATRVTKPLAGHFAKAGVEVRNRRVQALRVGRVPRAYGPAVRVIGLQLREQAGHVHVGLLFRTDLARIGDRRTRGVRDVDLVRGLAFTAIGVVDDPAERGVSGYRKRRRVVVDGEARRRIRRPVRDAGRCRRPGRHGHDRDRGE